MAEPEPWGQVKNFCHLIPNLILEYNGKQAKFLGGEDLSSGVPCTLMFTLLKLSAQKSNLPFTISHGRVLCDHS